MQVEGYLGSQENRIGRNRGRVWAYMKVSEEGKRSGAGGSENLRDFQEIWTMELSCGWGGRRLWSSALKMTVRETTILSHWPSPG